MNHVGNNLWTRWRLRPCKKRAISSPGGIIPNRQAFPSTGYKHLFFVQRKSKCSQASDMPRQCWFINYRTISEVVAFTLEGLWTDGIWCATRAVVHRLPNHQQGCSTYIRGSLDWWFQRCNIPHRQNYATHMDAPMSGNECVTAGLTCLSRKRGQRETSWGPCRLPAACRWESFECVSESGHTCRWTRLRGWRSVTFGPTEPSRFIITQLYIEFERRVLLL